ncbi:hypothetical protein CEXT_815661 [Caerostris extrusa]|uniref:Uncharacterized protein n=1 Tax=Caerostris extrusa TaxID=172846 RepID=A0AAV4S464_CAEEX|nr:hypothetical protein CEXT_815661 [Caerostris extrusa]
MRWSPCGIGVFLEESGFSRAVSGQDEVRVERGEKVRRRMRSGAYPSRLLIWSLATTALTITYRWTKEQAVWQDQRRIRVFMFAENETSLRFVSDNQNSRSGFDIRVRQITTCNPDAPGEK